MDWEKEYERLRQAKTDEQGLLFDEKTIKKVKLLTEWHRKMFMEYFDGAFLGKINLKIGSFVSYRTPILNFLLFENINDKYLSELTQEDIDNFIVIKGQKVKTATLSVNIYAIKNYLEFHAKHLKFTPEYIVFKKDEYNLENIINPLSCKELEQIREIIKDRPFLRFIFELAYENGVRFENSRKYCKKNYNEKEGSFSMQKGKKVFVSKKLRNIISKVQDMEEFDNQLYKQGISLDALKELLVEKGFDRKIKSSDVNNTIKKKTSFICPECGSEYEAIAGNWVIKQYNETSEQWIVCRKKCGEGYASI